MASFDVQDPTTGKSVTIEGDSAPSEQELNDIFSAVHGDKPQPSLGSQMLNTVSDTIAGSPLGAGAQAVNAVGQGANWLLDKTGIPVGDTVQRGAKYLFSPFRALGVGLAENMVPGGNPIHTTQETMDAFNPDYQPKNMLDQAGAFIGENAPVIAAGMFNPVAGAAAMTAQQAAQTGKASPLPLMTATVPSIFNKSKPALKSVGAKVGSYVGDIPEESVRFKMENPGMVNKASDIAELSSNELPSVANKYNQAIEGLHSQAKKTLSTSRYLEPTGDDVGGAFTKDEVLGSIKTARNKLGGVYTPESQAASNTLDKIETNLGKIRNTVSQNQVHDLIMDLDNEIPWDKVNRSPDTLTMQDKALIDTRTKLDNLLKSKNKDYAKVMQPLSEVIEGRNQFTKNFGLDKVRGGGYTPSNSTPSRLFGATNENRLATKRILGRTKELLGEDIAPKVKAAQVKSDFLPETNRSFNADRTGFRQTFGRPLVNKAIDAMSDVSSDAPRGIRSAIPGVSSLVLTEGKAREFLKQAGWDKDEARRLARKAGYTWK